MPESILNFLQTGLLGWTWWQMLLAFIIMNQLTIFSVTIYLHRSAAHRGVDLHPALQHLFRFWNWLTTGQITKEWVAIHRKHHAACETEEDPHSPQTRGIMKVLWEGAELYKEARGDREMIEKYGKGTPDDWLERNIYANDWSGPTLMWFINFAAFGTWGIVMWAIQMMWIPLFAAGVINGLGHWWGYRNFVTDDTSHNLTPWGLLLGGEELHNNHHAFPSSARFALRRWEFDPGWLFLCTMQTLGLAKIRRVAPKLAIEQEREALDTESLKALFTHRFHVMKVYCRTVVKPVLREECERAGESLRRMRRKARRLLTSDQRFFNDDKQQRLDQLLDRHAALQTVHEFRMRLANMWDRKNTDAEALLESFRQWCREAEATGNRYLQDFARSLPTYRLQAA